MDIYKSFVPATRPARFLKPGRSWLKLIALRQKYINCREKPVCLPSHYRLSGKYSDQ